MAVDLVFERIGGQPNPSFAAVQGTTGPDVLAGGGGDDLLQGLGGADRLDGGEGNDTLVGGPGADTISTGGGFDVIQIAGGDSGSTFGSIDVVTDWSPNDRILFGTNYAGANNYLETTAADYQAGLSFAAGQIGSGLSDVVAVAVGGDIYVFGRGGEAIALAGRTLGQVHFTNFAPGTGTPPAGPPGPTPAAPEATTGNDLMATGPLTSEIHGLAGNDTLIGTTVVDYLRGDDGNDSISGGSLFDDANGNMGADTIHGNDGDDYSVGGKDDDVLFGDNGADIVWGNLGDDTCDGGDGNDQVRGGQGNDSVAGGAGDDFVSGDRGNDTISGGAGADLFHGSQDAGIDRVLDFSLAQGDRVQLDPGTTYTLSQVGADTVIDMGGGHQMILVGVQLSMLPDGWIFYG